jgi:hypothetical protein
MPLGVVAGKAAYLDAIDGGMWNYGDDSYPEAETTFFTGTFCKHPLTIASAWAVLKYLKEQGPDLQNRLNARTSRLADSLNLFFKEENAPFYVPHFGSLFLFRQLAGGTGATLGGELLRYHLLDRGIYLWEGPTRFLSTAHTDEDLDYLIWAVKDSVREMREGGFLGATSKPATGQAAGQERSPVESKSGSSIEPVSRLGEPRLSFAQQRLWFLDQLEPNNAFYNVCIGGHLTGALNVETLRQCLNEIIRRHESLRTVFPSIEGRPIQAILPALTLDYPLVDLSALSEQARSSWQDANISSSSPSTTSSPTDGRLESFSMS